MKKIEEIYNKCLNTPNTKPFAFLNSHDFEELELYILHETESSRKFEDLTKDEKYLVLFANMPCRNTRYIRAWYKPSMAVSAYVPLEKLGLYMKPDETIRNYSAGRDSDLLAEWENAWNLLRRFVEVDKKNNPNRPERLRILAATLDSYKGTLHTDFIRKNLANGRILNDFNEMAREEKTTGIKHECEPYANIVFDLDIEDFNWNKGLGNEVETLFHEWNDKYNFHGERNLIGLLNYVVMFELKEHFAGYFPTLEQVQTYFMSAEFAETIEKEMEHQLNSIKTYIAENPWYQERTGKE